MSELMSVELTRTELVGLLERLELTPRFDGRTEVRDAVKKALRARQYRPAPLRVEARNLAAVSRSIARADILTATLLSKLKRAVPADQA